jgi:hypothetical protein
MKAFNTTLLSITLAFGALGVYAQAPSSDNQDQQPGHWRKATDQPAAPQSVQQTAAQQRGDDSEDRAMSNPDDGQDAPPAAENQQEQGPPPPANRSWQNGPGQPPVQGGQQQRQWSRFGDRPMPMARPRQPMPPTMTLQAGTWVSFRVNQPLSSDHNQQGDAFMGTLAEPLVVNGMVIARRGQTVSGRVVEAQKAGRVSGTSKLGIELTEIALADGQQITVHTQMAERRGGTSYGRDAAAIGTTTAAGAMIGAGVNGGVGAGVGAAGGLVASTVGVLLTRGKQTVLYPEQVLTFRLVNPRRRCALRATSPPACGPAYPAPWKPVISTVLRGSSMLLRRWCRMRPCSHIPEAEMTTNGPCRSFSFLESAASRMYCRR